MEWKVLWIHSCPYVRTSVCPYVCNQFLSEKSLFFLEILRSDRNLVADKIGRSVFAEKFFFYPYLHKKDQNGPKIKFSWVFIRFSQ